MQSPRALELDDESIYAMLRPYVAEWFRRRYGSFTEPQRGAIPLIKAGKNVLVSSPTGTGKTLAVFLGIIDELFALAERGELEDAIYAVYVSPLRALNNDMRRNLLEPLEGIRRVAEEMGYQLPEVRVAVRTSDTPPSEKQRMLRKPPHILITTPESLAIALAAPKFRERLATARWVIVDEIHELASNKRGAHLALSLERLEHLVRSRGGRLQRIGLSATIAPLEEVARFLGGYEDDGSPRPVEIVDARFAKPIDVRVLAPALDLVHADPEELNNAIYEILADLVAEHKTVLVFTNTRSATERVVFKLKKILKERGIIKSDDEVEAHHSSLSRSIRLDVEERLKRGELKVVVSSTSLELGIDIGYIDLVVLLSSPKSVSRLLQRIGRAGHHIRQVSKGRIIVVDRDDLVECTVLAKSAMERFIDKVRIPRNPLDVLAQHIVGMAVEQKWRIDEAYRLVRRAYNYHTLAFDDFMGVLRWLAGRHGLEDEGVYAKIWLDEGEGVFGRKRSARMIYQLNAGTIPDEAKIVVYTTSGKYVGDLEEEFVEILMPGDIFVLGGRTYKFLYSHGMKVIVEPVEGARPTVPSWFSEMLPLSFDSALRVGEFRCRIGSLIEEGREDEAFNLLVEDYMLQPHAARSIIEYFREQLEYAGVIPCHNRVLVEYFPYEEGNAIVFHALYGRRVVDALSRAYASTLSKLTRSPVRVTVTDNGFMLTLPENVRVTRRLISRLLSSVRSHELRRVLEESIAHTELMKRRFRHVAQRSFMILRRYKGRERSPERLQLSAQHLLEILLREYPDSPVVRETFREILEDYMDVENARRVLEWIERGEVETVILGPLEYPTPFAHMIVARGFSDVVLMEDRKRLIAELHRRVLEIIGSRGGLVQRDEVA